jgi:hypothetical protein
MSDNTLVNDDTGSSDKQAQAQEKFYSQKEFDDAMAKLKSSVARKYERQLEDLGDLEELKRIKAEAEQRKVEDQKKRGDYDKIIAELAARKDEEIRKRDDIIKNYTVDIPIVDAAAQLGAVNPAQVRQLVRNSVRLSDGGEVEIVDDKGSVRYSDRGKPFGVQDLVKEFLDKNPHFRSATPATTHSKSNVSQSREKFDVTRLDMSNPQDRKAYADYRRQQGIS